MKYKTCNVSVKAAGADTAVDDGTFEAIVSVFGNVDAWGDVVVAGAFADTIAEWKSSGDAIPVLWSHRMDDPMFNIGSVLDAAELAPGDARIPEWADQWIKDHGGLWVKGVLDTGDGASPIAVQARNLLRKRRVTQFSYAYDIIDGGPATVDGANAYELRKLKLYEVSPTQIGCNDRTELLGAKTRGKAGAPADAALAALIGQADASIDAALAAVVAADEALDEVLDAMGLPDTDDDDAGEDNTKARARRLLLKVGRTLSAKNEGNIRKAVELLSETLAALDSGDSTEEPAKTEEPAGAKAEEPANSAQSIRVLHDLMACELQVFA